MRVVSRGPLALVLGVVLLAGAVGPALASDHPPRHHPDASKVAPNADGNATLEATQEFRLTPERSGEVTVQLRYDVPDPVVSLRTQVPEEAAVTDVEGFEPGSNREYRWDGSTSRPALTYVLPVNRSLTDDSPEGAAGSLVSVDAGSWAMFRRPSTNTQYDHTDPVNFSLRRTTVGPGETGEWLVFLGDSEVYERSAYGQTFRFVVPANANTSAPPGTVLDSMVHAAGSLQVGDRDEEVFVVAAPTDGVAWGVRGAHVGDADLWVRDAEPLASADNAWIHEYVHSRQQFSLAPEMRWFREASASYYAALLTFEQGHIGYDEFRARIAAGQRSAYDDAVLADQSTWERYPAYDRGALVAGQVDRRIRLASDGNRSLQSVVEALNDRSNQTSVAAFRDAVGEAGNRSVASRSERYATTATDASAWNASAHAAAFGSLPPDLDYRLSVADGDGSYLLTGPYRTSVITDRSSIHAVSGEQLFLDVNVTNGDSSPATYNATLLVNGTVTDWQAGIVPGNETALVRVNHTFRRPGRYALAVGDDRFEVDVAEPADPAVGSFTVTRQTVEQGDVVRVYASAANPWSVPAGDTVTITRDGDPVATEEIRLAPNEIRTIYASVPMRTPGTSVLRLDGGDPVDIRVEANGTATGGTGAGDSVTSSPAVTSPSTTRVDRSGAGADANRSVPVTGTGSVGNGTVVLLALVALGLLARART